MASAFRSAVGLPALTTPGDAPAARRWSTTLVSTGDCLRTGPLILAAALLVAAAGSGTAQTRIGLQAIDEAVELLERNNLATFDFNSPAFRGMGKEEAPLVLIEFSDYQCDHCAIFHDTVFRGIKSEFIDTGLLYYVALNHPQDDHPLGALAAEAAYCIGDHASFWDTRELLFASTPYLNERVIRELVDAHVAARGEIRACLRSARYGALVQAEKRAGLRVGVTITPSFILGRKAGRKAVGGTLIEGAPLWSEFNKLIRDALEMAVKPKE